MAAPVLVGLGERRRLPTPRRDRVPGRRVDLQTGTIRTHANWKHVFAFTAGLFARVRLLGDKKYDAMLINESAVGTDQGLKYVFGSARTTPSSTGR